MLAELERHCPFVPPAAVERSREHLPASPRKLKHLVRRLYLYTSEAERHDQGEIDWPSVVGSELMRLYSEKGREVAVRLIDGRSTGDAYFDELVAGASDQKLPPRDRLLAVYKGEGDDRIADIVQTFSKSGYPSGYSLRLLDEPSVFTRQEVRRFAIDAGADISPEALAARLEANAATAGLPVADVALDLARQSIGLLRDELRRTHVTAEAETRAHAEMTNLATVIEHLFARHGSIERSELEAWTEQFGSFVDACVRPLAQPRDLDTLCRILAGSGPMGFHYVARVENHPRYRDDQATWPSILEAMRAAARPALVDQLVVRLQTNPSLLFGPDVPRAAHDLLFDPHSSVWTSLRDWLRSGDGATEAARSSNVFYFLQATCDSPDPRVQQARTELLQSEELVRQFWGVLAVDGLSARWQQLVLQLRGRLAELSVPLPWLPLPENFADAED